MDIFGIINVDKPYGWTSFRVVALVRRLSRTRRVGHAGTLDPLATGVLLVCLGNATRLVRHLTAEAKTYRAEVQLGVATDTYDAEGTPVFSGDPSHLTVADIERAVASFVGLIRQSPPPFSAVKHKGRPLYSYARVGKPIVGIPQREVRVDRIDILGFSLPNLVLEIVCGKGTYVRSLAHDLGQKLGCGAYLRSLVRTQLGPFELGAACTVDQLRLAFADGYWPELVHYPDVALSTWQAAILSEDDERAVRNGKPIVLSQRPAAQTSGRGDLCRAYSRDGHLIGILRYVGDDGLWWPTTVFSSSTTQEIWAN